MAESIRTRLKSRLAQLRESRKILAKRSARRQQGEGPADEGAQEPGSAVKHHKPKHLIDQLQHKLEIAHWELDKAVLGKEEYEKRTKRLEKKVKYLKDHVPPPAPRVGLRRRQHPQRPLEPIAPADQQLDHPVAAEDLERPTSASPSRAATARPSTSVKSAAPCVATAPAAAPAAAPPMGQSNHGQQYGPARARWT